MSFSQQSATIINNDTASIASTPSSIVLSDDDSTYSTSPRLLSAETNSDCDHSSQSNPTLLKRSCSSSSFSSSSDSSHTALSLDEQPSTSRLALSSCASGNSGDLGIVSPSCANSSYPVQSRCVSDPVSFSTASNHHHPGKESLSSIPQPTQSTQSTQPSLGPSLPSSAFPLLLPPPSVVDSFSPPKQPRVVFHHCPQHRQPTLPLSSSKSTNKSTAKPTSASTSSGSSDNSDTALMATTEVEDTVIVAVGAVSDSDVAVDDCRHNNKNNKNSNNRCSSGAGQSSLVPHSTLNLDSTTVTECVVETEEEEGHHQPPSKTSATAAATTTTPATIGNIETSTTCSSSSSTAAAAAAIESPSIFSTAGGQLNTCRSHSQKQHSHSHLHLQPHSQHIPNHIVAVATPTSKDSSSVASTAPALTRQKCPILVNHQGSIPAQVTASSSSSSSSSSTSSASASSSSQAQAQAPAAADNKTVSSSAVTTTAPFTASPAVLSSLSRSLGRQSTITNTVNNSSNNTVNNNVSGFVPTNSAVTPVNNSFLVNGANIANQLGLPFQPPFSLPPHPALQRVGNPARFLLPPLSTANLLPPINTSTSATTPLPLSSHLTALHRLQPQSAVSAAASASASFSPFTSHIHPGPSTPGLILPSLLAIQGSSTSISRPFGRVGSTPLTSISTPVSAVSNIPNPSSLPLSSSSSERRNLSSASSAAVLHAAATIAAATSATNACTFNRVNRVRLLPDSSCGKSGPSYAVVQSPPFTSAQLAHNTSNLSSSAAQAMSASSLSASAAASSVRTGGATNSPAHMMVSPMRSIKHRNRLTPQQTQELTNYYENINSKPTSDDRKKIGFQLGLKPRTIQVWFQNRRAKSKRETTGVNATSSNSSNGNFSSTMPKMNGAIAIGAQSRLGTGASTADTLTPALVTSASGTPSIMVVPPRSNLHLASTTAAAAAAVSALHTPSASLSYYSSLATAPLGQSISNTGSDLVSSLLGYSTSTANLNLSSWPDYSNIFSLGSNINGNGSHPDTASAASLLNPEPASMWLSTSNESNTTAVSNFANGHRNNLQHPDASERDDASNYDSDSDGDFGGLDEVGDDDIVTDLAITSAVIDRNISNDGSNTSGIKRRMSLVDAGDDYDGDNTAVDHMANFGADKYSDYITEPPAKRRAPSTCDTTNSALGLISSPTMLSAINNRSSAIAAAKGLSIDSVTAMQHLQQQQYQQPATTMAAATAHTTATATAGGVSGGDIASSALATAQDPTLMSLLGLNGFPASAFDSTANILGIQSGSLLPTTTDAMPAVETDAHSATTAPAMSSIAKAPLLAPIADDSFISPLELTDLALLQSYISSGQYQQQQQPQSQQRQHQHQHQHQRHQSLFASSVFDPVLPISPPESGARRSLTYGTLPMSTLETPVRQVQHSHQPSLQHQLQLLSQNHQMYPTPETVRPLRNFSACGSNGNGGGNVFDTPPCLPLTNVHRGSHQHQHQHQHQQPLQAPNSASSLADGFSFMLSGLDHPQQD